MGNNKTKVEILKSTFRFPKRAPKAKSDLGKLFPDASSGYSLTVFLLIFLLTAVGIAGIGYQYYQNYERQFRAQVENQLASIAQLKVEQLQSWRDERLADAQIRGQNPAFAALVQDFLERPEDLPAREELQTWLDLIYASHHYNRVFLLDTNGVERISSPATPEATPAHLVEQEAAVLDSGQIVFQDLHRNEENGAIHLAMLVPIYSVQDHHPLGMFVLRMDANAYLYPLIQKWPIPSQTGETLIVRREGDEVVFLNDLRFQSGAALNLRFPLEDTQLTAVQAVLGRTGIVEGLDYSGVPVVACVLPVPDSPWFVVAKTDTAEVYAPLQQRLWQTLAFFGALILACGSGLMVVWRQQRVRYYRGRAQAAEALRESEERYRGLFENMLEGYAYCRMLYENGDPSDFVYLAVNEKFESLTGLKDAAGKRVSVLIPGIHQSNPELFEIYSRVAQTGKPERFETFVSPMQMWFSVSVYSPAKDHFVAVFDVITERKRAEAEQAKLTQRLDLATDAAHMGIWDWDIQKNELVWDDQMYALYGIHPGEFGGAYESWLHGIHPDDRAASDEISAQAVRGERDYDAEFRVLWPDGSVHWLKANGQVFRDERGDPVRMVGVNYDITGRKQAEEVLRRSEMLLREMGRIAKIGGWELDVATMKQEWTDETYAIHDRERGIYDPDSTEEISRFEPGSKERIGKAFEEAIGQGKPYDLEVEMTTVKRNRKWVRAVCLPLQKDGKVIKLTGTVQDITERKQAEEALKESEERFSTAFFTSPVAQSIIVQGSNEILAVNDACCRLFEYSPEELIGTSTTKLHLWENPTDRLAAVEELQRTGHLLPREATIRTKSGTIRTVIFALEPISWKGLPCYISSIFDITERKWAEEELHRTLEELKHSNAELEQFAYVASHDLQEPLRAVAGMVQLLEQRYKGQLDERADEYIHYAVEAASRMQALINDLLAFSRVERRGKPFERVDMNRCVQAAIANLRMAVQESNAHVTCEDLPSVAGDAAQLIQLFQNLIGNGIKFRGEKEPQVHVSARRLDGDWQFSVRDNGIGIESQYFERIFLVFQRLHPHRAYPGTGIGLALCDKIVERHGGRIWVESEPGKGSTFHFTLPFRRPS